MAGRYVELIDFLGCIFPTCFVLVGSSAVLKNNKAEVKPMGQLQDH